MSKESGANHNNSDSVFISIAKSIWPLVVATVLFYALWHSRHSNLLLLDPYTWHSLKQMSCNVSDEACGARNSLLVLLRMITMSAALLPLLNYPSYVREVSAVVRENRDTKLDQPVMYLAFIALIANVLWLLVTYYGEHDLPNGANEILIIVLFAVFSLIDLLLMNMHRPRGSAIHYSEYDFFFGNTFFIDIPTLTGVILIAVFSAAEISKGFGDSRELVEKSLSGGAVVMHVVLSQIVYVFLQLQLRLKKARK